MRMRKIYNFNFKNNIIFIIILFAFILRFFELGKMPPSLNWDEVSHGYNAYSILKTGMDEWGKPYPIIFRAYGDYKLPVYIYFTSILEFFLGTKSISVRIPSAISGVGLVFLTYLITLKLFKGVFSKNSTYTLALLSSFLVSIEPWTFFLSRAAFEANVALFLIVFGVYLFLVGLERKIYLVFSIISFGLSVWTYNSARVFVPLLLLTLVAVYYRDIFKILKKEIFYLRLLFFLFLLFFTPMFYQLASPSGQARYSKVSIIDEGAIEKINELRTNSKYPLVLTKILYNRPLFFIKSFIFNWISHFSLGFLFFNGGSNYQFNVPSHGILYFVNLPFFIIGFVFVLKKSLEKRKNFLIILIWFLIAPVASSLTRESPHTLRASTMIPIPMILSSIGFFIFWSAFPKVKKFVLIFYVFLIFIFAERYLFLYFENYKKNYSWVWQYGYHEAVSFLKENYDKYDKIIFSKVYGEPHEFILFYWPWNPLKYIEDDNLTRFYQSGWFWVDSFDKFYFVNDWDIPKDESENFKLESGKIVSCSESYLSCLLVTSPDNFPKGFSKLYTINFLDGRKAFEIYEKRSSL